MNMAAIKGVCFSCTLQGKIISILKDDIELFNILKKPATFFETISADSLTKSVEFWTILNNESAVFDYELTVPLNGRSEAYKFSGIIHEKEVIITISKQDEALEHMFDELMRINNEQQNQLRQSQKSLSIFKKKNHNDTDEFLLNDLTSLNNELINTQRELVKKNAEIEKLNRALKAANINLEQFAYVTSHDLKEPLRMITNFMGLLKTKYNGQLDDKAHTYINFAIDGGRRMQKMITDLLELSRTGRMEKGKEITDLNEIVMEVKLNIAKLIDEKKAQIIIKNPLPKVDVFRTDITRVFQNLVSNALKFCKPDLPGQVIIDVVMQNNQWVFSISDNGIGIDPLQFERIFEVFSRLHGSEEYEGTGIGLAIVKKSIENHGGKVWVESSAGQGSTFYFTIPK